MKKEGIFEEGGVISLNKLVSRLHIREKVGIFPRAELANQYGFDQEGNETTKRIPRGIQTRHIERGTSHLLEVSEAENKGEGWRKKYLKGHGLDSGTTHSSRASYGT